MENYRQLKTQDQFWKKNENPNFKEFNITPRNDNIDAIEKKVIEDTKKLKEERKQNEIKKKNEQKLIEKNNNKLLQQKITITKTENTNLDNDIQKEAKNEKIENNNNNLIEEKQNQEYTEEKNNENENERPLLDPLLDDDNENVDEIIEYLKGLDYDKYCKDMQIREALELLKNKMNKDKLEKEQEEELNKNKITTIEDNTNQNAKNIPQNIEEYESKNQDVYTEDKKNKLILPEITNKIPEQNNNEIVDEEELKKKEEIKKYKLAEQIAKTEQMKAVHSVNSVRKLLQREGLENAKEVAPLRITVIKENPIACLDGYEPKKLPFLHSLPLV